MSRLRPLVAVGLIVLLAVVLVPQVKAADEIQRQSLGFSKNYFFYTMTSEVDHYNNKANANAHLESQEAYCPLPDHTDGWQWSFSNGVSFVAVGGPEDSVKEAFFITSLSGTGNDAQTTEIAVGILAFNAVIWGQDTDLSNAATSWITQQLGANSAGAQTQIGDKILLTLVDELSNGESYFAIEVVGQEVQPAPLPWWTILGIITGLIALCTFLYKAITYLRKRKSTKPTTTMPPPPPPPTYTIALTFRFSVN